MTDQAATTATPHIPTIVRRLNPLVRRLLRLGMPMGPNVLLTVRGRKSGLERTFPVAILEVGEGTYVFSPFGEVDWVRNLRAAGVAEIRRGRRTTAMTARELAPGDAAPLLEAGLRDAMGMPLVGPMIAGWYGIDRASTAEDFLAAARRHPGFELLPA